MTVETRRDLDGSDGLAGAEEVDVPGAKQALLFREQRTLEGNPFEFFELALQLEDDSLMFFGGLFARDGEFDADAVLDSFRLDG